MWAGAFWGQHLSPELNSPSVEMTLRERQAKGVPTGVWHCVALLVFVSLESLTPLRSIHHLDSSVFGGLIVKCDLKDYS